MAHPPIYDKKEDIPKGFEPLYAEKDGKWHFKTEGTSTLEETLRKVREEKKEAERLAREAEDKRADLERKLAAATSDDDKKTLAKALEKFDQDLTKAKEAHKKEIDELTAKLKRLQVDDRVKSEFVKAGGRPERQEQMLKLEGEVFDLAEDRVVIKDAKGQPTTQTLEDFFAKTYRERMPDFYTGTKGTGGGGKGGASDLPAPGTKVSGDDVLKDPLKALQTANAQATGK